MIEIMMLACRFLCILCVSYYYRPKRAVSGSLKNILFMIASKSYDADYLARIGPFEAVSAMKTMHISHKYITNEQL